MTTLSVVNMIIVDSIQYLSTMLSSVNSNTFPLYLCYYHDHSIYIPVLPKLYLDSIHVPAYYVYSIIMVIIDSICAHYIVCMLFSVDYIHVATHV